MKRTAVLKKIRQAARDADLDYMETELTNHTGLRVGGVSTVVARHLDIPQFTAETIFKQLEPALGKGWWRR